MFFYENDVIKDNMIKEAHNIINTKEIKKLKALKATQQKWLGAKGGKMTKGVGTALSVDNRAYAGYLLC